MAKIWTGGNAAIEISGASAQHRKYILALGLKKWLDRYEIGWEPTDSEILTEAKNRGVALRHPQKAGRKRVFKSTAEKQRAYRKRRSSGVTKLNTGE